MKRFYMNYIVRLTTMLIVCITFFLVISEIGNTAYKILCVVGFIVSIYLMLYAFTANFTVYEDKIVFKKPFKTYNLYWKDIGLISAVEYRKNNFNIYLNPLKEIRELSTNTSILINWQFNNYKELVKIILTHCDKSEDIYIDKKVYKAIEC